MLFRSYVIDLLTGTTSGPELPDDAIKVWFEQRNAVNRYFAAHGYPDINANKKPWGDGPYGRETQAIRLFEPKRNSLTTDATARLLLEIVQGQCVTAQRSREMMELLARDIGTSDPDPDNQAKFTGPALPAGSKDAALVVTLAAAQGYSVQVSGAAGTSGIVLLEV